MLRWPLVLVVLLWIHRHGWWSGGVYLEEDVAAQFYLYKSRLYQLVRGQEAWSWWDPLTLLGSPRLANVQTGWLSPTNLWFLLIDPVRAWRYYPLVSDILLIGCGYLAARRLGASAAAATWSSTLWVLSGGVIFETQHPCFKEALAASLLGVASAAEFVARGSRKALLGLVVSGYLLVAVGSPSAVYFLGMSLPFFLLWLRPTRSRLLRLALAFGAGMLAAAPSLLPLADYLSHSHRGEDAVAGTAISETYRLTLTEVLRRFASESLLSGDPPRLEHAPQYFLFLDFSLALTLLALSALAIPRLRWFLALNVVLVLQSMGESGGLVWLLHRVAPFTLAFRGPARFYFLGAWGICLCAALAWDHWRRQGGGKARLAQAGAVWSVLFLFWAQTVPYRDAQLLDRPPAPPYTGGRVSVARYSKPRPSLLWETSSVLERMPTLLMPESLWERGYLQGLALSQLGPDGPAQLGELIRKVQQVPVRNPESPLLLSWGLTWLLEGQGQSFAWRRVQPDPPRHWWSTVTTEEPRLWASRTSGDPFATAVLETPPPGPGPGGKLVVVADGPDYQELNVEGQGLLISGDQWDPGWECYHDGQLVPTLRANLALKACWVEAGVKQVTWRYRLRWWPKAVVLWVLALLVAIVSWVFPDRTPRP